MFRSPTIRHLIAPVRGDAPPTSSGVMHERADLAHRSAPGVDTLGAEVVHVIRHEMAVRLTDIVVRRTGLGSAGAPPRDAVARCARIAAAELGWDDDACPEEIAARRTFCAIW